MKISVNNRQVAHLFAAASQPEARGSNFRFKTNTIEINGKEKKFLVLYSYLTPIAFQRVDTKPTEPAGPVFITNYKYSLSTGRQISYLQNACNHRTTVSVDHIPQGSYAHRFISQTMDKKQMRTRLLAEFKETTRTVAKLDKRSKPKAAAIFRNRVISQLSSFHTIHGKDLKYTFPISLAELANDYNLKQTARNEKREAAYAEMNKERLALEAKILAEDLPKWKAGERVYLPSHSTAYLRLKSDGETVQTSHGAEVPLKLALAFYRRLLAGEARPGQHVGSFTLNDCTGDPIRIGCHTIMRSEMMRLYMSKELDYARAIANDEACTTMAGGDPDQDLN